MLARVSSRNFILGGKLTDHVAVRPPRGEGRLHNYNYWQYLGGGGGGGGGGGELSCLGGGGGASPAPPSLVETLLAHSLVCLSYRFYTLL